MTRTLVRWSLFGLVLALSVGIASPLAAGPRSDLPNQAEAERAISQLRSPYCPGLMLEVCPSPEASALRDSIRYLAAEGLESRAIVEWMIANHGEEWRAVPQRTGRGIWAWVIPPLFLVLGAGFLITRLRSDRLEAEQKLEPVDPEGELSEVERARLAAALREFEVEGAEDV